MKALESKFKKYYLNIQRIKKALNSSKSKKFAKDKIFIKDRFLELISIKVL